MKNGQKEEEITIPFNENLSIWYGYNINYIESNNNDLRIVYKHYKYYDVYVEKNSNYIHFNTYSSNEQDIKSACSI